MNIKNGEEIIEKMVDIRRPGYGIPLKYFDMIIRKTAKKILKLMSRYHGV